MPRVRGGHYVVQQCFPLGGVWYPCYQPVLAAPGMTVKRSPRRGYRHRVQYVQIVRMLYRRWYHDAAWEPTLAGYQTMKLKPHKHKVRFGSWSKVPAGPGWGYYKVMYSIAWLNARGHIIGERQVRQRGFTCQTSLRCYAYTGSIWLSDPD